MLKKYIIKDKFICQEMIFHISYALGCAIFFCSASVVNGFRWMSPMDDSGTISLYSFLVLFPLSFVQMFIINFCLL